MPKPRPEELVTSGSPEHRRRFREGLDSLLAIVPPARIILNRVYWSEVDEVGEPFTNPRATAAANALLDDFYELARERGVVRELSYSPDLLVANAHHKWGRSPFHYVHPFYERTLDQLAQSGNR